MSANYCKTQATLLILCALMIVLTGCTTWRTVVAERGAEVADIEVEVAHYGVCKPPTAGALERRYNLFSDPTGPKAKGWLGFCHPNGD